MKRYKRKINRQYTGIINSHIQKNIREYTIGSIIFLIGILLGIAFINNLNDVQSNEITSYISNSVSILKQGNEIDKMDILKESIINNIFLVFLLWLIGSTVIGIFLVYIILCFKGFSFRLYNISNSTITWYWKGYNFCNVHFIY